MRALHLIDWRIGLIAGLGAGGQGNVGLLAFPHLQGGDRMATWTVLEKENGKWQDLK